MRLHLPVMMRAALMAVLLAGELPAEEAAPCMAAGDGWAEGRTIYVAPPEESGEADTAPLAITTLPEGEYALTQEGFLRQYAYSETDIGWLDAARRTMTGNQPHRATVQWDVREGVVYAADDKFTGRTGTLPAETGGAWHTGATCTEIRVTPARGRITAASPYTTRKKAGREEAPAAPRVDWREIISSAIPESGQQTAEGSAVAGTPASERCADTAPAARRQAPWVGAGWDWWWEPGRFLWTDAPAGAPRTAEPVDLWRDWAGITLAPAKAWHPATGGVVQPPVEDIPAGTTTAAAVEMAGVRPSPTGVYGMDASGLTLEQQAQPVLPAAAPVQSYGTVQPGTVAASFPTNDATVTISGLVDVTPATMPAWSGTTGILGPNVTEVAGTDKTARPDSLILDAQHGNRWVMQVGTGTGAGSSKTVYVRYLDTFTLKNLGDTAGGDASSLDFGITSGANSANTSLTIRDNNEVNLVDNVRLVTSAHGFINLQGTLSIRNNARVNITGNKVLSTCGNTVRNVHGTIHTEDSIYLSYNTERLRLEGNGIVIGPADNCYVGVRGGAAFAKSVSITYNSGAVYIRNNTITHQEGVDTSAEALGGAVDSREILLSSNSGRVEVSGNGVDLSAASWGTLRGGAFSVELIAYIAFTPTVTPWGDGGTTNLSLGLEPGPVISGLGSNVVPAVGITINSNKADVEISRNYLKCGGGTSSGGALFCQGNDEDNHASISIGSNKAGLVFADNYASGRVVRGGAICAAEFTDFTLSGNADVSFTGNTIQGMVEGDDLKGGAIYIDDDAKTIKFTNNTKLVFRGNAEISHDGSVLLRSVYANTDSTTYTAKASSLELTPANGGTLEVYDSITLINSSDGNKVVSINKQGSTKKTGTVLFSGKYTEADLKAAKGGVAATAAEVEASRTNVIEGATVCMQSGTLAIKDSAKLLIHGKAETDTSEFSASELVLEAGDLIIQDSALTTFDAMTISLARGANGMTSHLAGTSTTAGGPTLKVTNVLTLNVADVKGATHGISFLAVDGMNLDMGGTVQLAITGFDGFEPGLRYDLIDISHAGTGWEDFLTCMAPTFTIDGEEYETALYVHEDSRSVYLLKAGPVPEPGTATLSLLALAALAARRRRW